MFSGVIFPLRTPLRWALAGRDRDFWWIRVTPIRWNNPNGLLSIFSLPLSKVVTKLAGMEEDPELLYGTRETQVYGYFDLRAIHKSQFLNCFVIMLWTCCDQVTLLQQTLAANDADVEEEGIGPQNSASAGVGLNLVMKYFQYFTSFWHFFLFSCYYFVLHQVRRKGNMASMSGADDAVYLEKKGGRQGIFRSIKIVML